jgi:hypothetical protein
MPKPKTKLVRWSFEPSAETLDAWRTYLAAIGMTEKTVNKSAYINELLCLGLKAQIAKIRADAPRPSNAPGRKAKGVK